MYLQLCNYVYTNLRLLYISMNKAHIYLFIYIMECPFNLSDSLVATPAFFCFLFPRISFCPFIFNLFTFLFQVSFPSYSFSICFVPHYLYVGFFCLLSTFYWIIFFPVDFWFIKLFTPLFLRHYLLYFKLLFLLVWFSFLKYTFVLYCFLWILSFHLWIIALLVFVAFLYHVILIL